MSHNLTPLEEKIASAAPAELSAAEEAVLFETVRTRVMGGSVSSPLTRSFIFSRPMIPLILILALTLGAGGTVAASDGARPGDLLFPVDRAIEDLRFSLASTEKKDELRIKFADERLREFDEIADDEAGDDDISGTLTEAEADIFTDETVVKLEAGDRKVTFVTDADTREEIIDVIVDRYGFTKDEVDAVLSVETEDRESTPDDRGEDKEHSDRLEHALDVLGDFIEQNRGAASTSPGVLNALAIIESRILDRANSFPEDVRVKVRDDRARYEVRSADGTRVRVEVKDGEVRVKTEDDEDEDEHEDDDHAEHSATSTSSRHGSDGRSGSSDDDSDDDEDSSHSSGSDDDEDDDNDSSGHGSDDDQDDDEDDDSSNDDKEDDNDSSGHGSGKDD